MLTKTHALPYYAVIFTSVLTEVQEGYGEIAAEMVRLAQLQDGFLGIESARDQIGITVSYWKDEASILQWKNVMEHKLAQKLGYEKFYASFNVRIAKVERAYSFEK